MKSSGIQTTALLGRQCHAKVSKLSYLEWQDARHSLNVVSNLTTLRARLKYSSSQDKKWSKSMNYARWTRAAKGQTEQQSEVRCLSGRHRFRGEVHQFHAPVSAVERARTCESIHSYVLRRPSSRGRLGAQPSCSRIRRLFEFLPRTPSGPGICRI